MSELAFQENFDWFNEFVHSSCFDSSPNLGCMKSDSVATEKLNFQLDNLVASSMQACEIVNNEQSEGGSYEFTWTCAECHEKEGGYYSKNLSEYRLLQHARSNCHRSYKCQIQECNQTFVSDGERRSHESTPHGIAHDRIQSQHPHHCIQCQENLRSKADLLRHAQERQHKPYGCSCGTLFSRIDVLNRHLRSFSTDVPQYPCIFCKRHRGNEGFRRKDHLLQHLKQYHHHEIDTPTETQDGTTKSASRLKYIFPICTHSECPQYRSPGFQQLPLSEKEAQKPFRSQSEFTQHMREEHNECTFPCDILGCSRVGRRGYFREKDLIKHRQQEHPEEESYIPLGKGTSHRCTEPGCGAVVDLSSVPRHYQCHEYNARRVQDEVVLKF